MKENVYKQSVEIDTNKLVGTGKEADATEAKAVNSVTEIIKKILLKSCDECEINIICTIASFVEKVSVLNALVKC